MSEKNGPPPPIGFVEPSVSSSLQSASAPPAENTALAGNLYPSQPYPNNAPYPAEPPPAYQSAMEYPTAAPYGRPPMNGAYPPKTMGSAPMYYPPPNITVLPQPAPPQPQIVHIHSTAARPTRGTQVVVVSTGPRCRHCNLGTMQRRMDMCCLITLIVLCIFTFPFGLIFLCCIPCAQEVTCSNCGRSN